MPAWMLYAALAHAGAPIEITVPTDVTKVVLVCAGNKRFETEAKNGLATFPEAPKDCKVYLQKPVGTIAGPGIWTCADDGCRMVDVQHKDIRDAPGRVNVILTGEYDTRWLEISCADGARQRADIETNTATFDGITRDDCTLFFKGGSPAQYRPIVAGSWRCGLTATTAVCTKFTP